MAGSKDQAGRDRDTTPTNRAPDRSPFTGIVVTIVVVVLAVAAIAFIGGAFTSEEVGEDLDNAALEGPVAGEADGDEDQGLVEQGEAQ